MKSELVCVADHSCHQRYVRNISMGGLYVDGPPCGNTGNRVSLVLTPVNKPLEHSQQFPASIIRVGGSGFALAFSALARQDQRALENIISPRWDGKNIFDGLLIVAAREEAIDLAECLRLTSVVCDRYRRVCAAGSSRPGHGVH